MSIHKQVSVDFFAEKITVDEGLAELLQLIWERGIFTLNSCQENRPGVAWIEFETSEAFEDFLNAVAVYPVGKDVQMWKTLYGRIVGCGGPDNWEYRNFPNIRGVREIIVDDDEIEEEYSGYNDFEMNISVRFPVTDIPLLVSILKDKE
jgi:hypothetical protein